MIRANVRPLQRRLKVARGEMLTVERTLAGFLVADNMINLTPEQAADVMADVQAKAADVAAAYDDAVEAFTAEEPVVEPEE